MVCVEVPSRFAFGLDRTATTHQLIFQSKSKLRRISSSAGTSGITTADHFRQLAKLGWVRKKGARLSSDTLVVLTLLYYTLL